MEESSYKLPQDLALAKSLIKILKITPPPTLYHYTSRAGFLGILEKRAVFASHVRYLNDANEIALAVRLAQEQIIRRFNSSTGEEKKLYDQLKQWLWTLESQIHVFVFSMTQNGDLLSQWRAYCKPNDGYSIGFASQKLSLHATSKSTFFLSPCVYKTEEHTLIISELIDDVRDMFHTKRASGSQLDSALSAATASFVISFLVAAPVIKDPAFHEEQEWRLLSWLNYASLSDQRVSYRDGRTLLIPYVVVELAPESEQLPINEIIIGPSSHREIEATAVMGYLIKSNTIDRTVKLSAVPFRGD
jgi:hypothetical protein